MTRPFSPAEPPKARPRFSGLHFAPWPVLSLVGLTQVLAGCAGDSSQPPIVTMEDLEGWVEIQEEPFLSWSDVELLAHVRNKSEHAVRMLGSFQEDPYRVILHLTTPSGEQVKAGYQIAQDRAYKTPSQMAAGETQSTTVRFDEFLFFTGTTSEDQAEYLMPETGRYNLSLEWKGVYAYWAPATFVLRHE